MEKKGRFCVVPLCVGLRFDLVHKFPNDNVRAEEWRTILNIPHLYTFTLEQIRKRYFVCSRHFRIQDYKNIKSRGLNKTALPSLNLKVFDHFDIIDNYFNKKPIDLNELNTETEDINQQSIEEYVLGDSTSSNQLHQNEMENEILDIDADEISHSKARTYSTKRKFVDVFKDNFIIKRQNEKEFLHYQIPNTTEQNDVSVIAVTSLSSFKDQLLHDIEDPLEEEQHCPESDLQSSEESTAYENDEVSINQSDQNVTDEDLDEVTPDCSIVEITHPDYVDPIKVHHFWLRDHCRCSLCYSEETSQRKFNILDIPIDIKIKAQSCNIVGKEIIIEWSDDHKSTYDIDFLFKTKYENHRNYLIKNENPILWDKNVIHESDYARVNLNDYLCEDAVARKVLRSLVKYGVAFIEKVPANLQSTEIAIKRLFPIQKTLFGEMYTLTDFKEHSDSAYSKEFLPAHTDNTYFNDACGLQILHCTQHNGTGGETLLLDGLKAVNDLKLKHPDVFERLLVSNMPAEYIEDGQHHYYCAPVIKKHPLTDIVEQIRFNLYDRAPLNSIPHDKVMQFYKDFRLLANEIQSPQNEWWFKLTPGTVLIFNNWRILHGRAQYTGKRVLCGSYVSRTDFMSVARSNGIIL